MKTLKKYWSLYREMPGILLMLQLISFVVGMLVVLVVNAAINDDGDYAPMGSFLALVLSGIMSILGVESSRMLLAVGMGQTRRSFILCDTFYHTVNFLMSMLVCRLLYSLELILYARIYPGFENGMSLEIFFSLPVIGLLTAVIAGAGLLLTMLRVRFGQKAFLFVWLAFSALSILGSRAISDAREGKASVLAAAGKGVMELTGAMSGLGWLLTGYGLAILIGIIGALGLRRSEIR